MNFHRNAGFYLRLWGWEKKINLQFFWKQHLIFSTHTVLNKLNQCQNQKRNDLHNDSLTWWLGVVAGSFLLGFMPSLRGN